MGVGSNVMMNQDDEKSMKVLMVDDHALFRDGLRLLLCSTHPDAQLLEASTLAGALSLLLEHADLTMCFLDLDLKQERGLPVLKKIKLESPNLPVVIVSGSEDSSTVRACMQAGAISYIPKSLTSEKFLYALQRVLKGEIFLPHEEENDVKPSAPSGIPNLTPRQREVLYALSRGFSTKSIARELSLSEYTVKDHISDLFRILGANNRVEAVTKASLFYLRPR